MTNHRFIRREIKGFRVITFPIFESYSTRNSFSSSLIFQRGPPRWVSTRRGYWDEVRRRERVWITFRNLREIVKRKLQGMSLFISL